MEPDFPALTQWAEKTCKSILDWPAKIKAMQRNWIGKSEGAEVHFEIDGKMVTVFTTRPDTLFGATYFVLSPEHPLVDKITTDKYKTSVENYKQACAAKSDLERTELNKNKTGVFTGAFTINPVNGEKIPVWIADYVLISYGTGAIMAVPAHDERDYEFAIEYNLPIKYVFHPMAEEDFETNEKKRGCIAGHGKCINSGFLTGLSTIEAIATMIEWLEKNKRGERKINYRLRDWIFTRQRYWGEPIPFVFDTAGKCYPLDESELPLKLPETPNYEPSSTGESPLAKITDWVNIEGYINDDGNVITKNIPKNATVQKFFRETSTMPNWAGSSWYWLRY